MRFVVEILGWLWLAAVLAGSFVPGWNFHVIFASDQSALEGHEMMAAKIRKRIGVQPTKEAS